VSAEGKPLHGAAKNSFMEWKPTFQKLAHRCCD
jgi:hypothetical protein